LNWGKFSSLEIQAEKQAENSVYLLRNKPIIFDVSLPRADDNVVPGSVDVNCDVNAKIPHGGSRPKPSTPPPQPGATGDTGPTGPQV